MLRSIVICFVDPGQYEFIEFYQIRTNKDKLSIRQYYRIERDNGILYQIVTPDRSIVMFCGPAPIRVY